MLGLKASVNTKERLRKRSASGWTRGGALAKVPVRWRQHLQPRRRCWSFRGGPRRAGLGPGLWASPMEKSAASTEPQGPRPVLGRDSVQVPDDQDFRSFRSECEAEAGWNLTYSKAGVSVWVQAVEMDRTLHKIKSTGSGRAGPAAMAHGPSHSAACRIFPDRGTNPCPLHRQADSQPLRHQGSPVQPVFAVTNWLCSEGRIIPVSQMKILGFRTEVLCPSQGHTGRKQQDRGLSDQTAWNCCKCELVGQRDGPSLLRGDFQVQSSSAELWKSPALPLSPGRAEDRVGNFVQRKNL
nr:START domain-containing protein 10 isoform X1 [Delphinus delphis]